MYGKPVLAPKPAPPADAEALPEAEPAANAPRRPSAPSIDDSLASVLRPSPAIASQLAAEGGPFGSHFASTHSAPTVDADESEEECLLLMLLEAMTF